MLRRQLANGLSLFRLLAALPTAYCIYHQFWPWAGVILLFAMLSDFADGYIARRLGTSSALGGLLDHSCDAIYVTSCLTALALSSELPVLLPVLVALSFLQYMLDSKALAGRALRSSILGRNNGIAYFVLVAIAVYGQILLATPLVTTIIETLAWLLIASTLISMTERFYTLFSKLPAST